MHFLHNEVSSAGLQGYLRQNAQLEQVWQQVDEQVTALTLQGLAPWEAHSKMGHALAFVRACRLSMVLAQKLVDGADPAHTGYIPRPIYDQAQALGELFEPYLEEAITLLRPQAVSRQPLPIPLRRTNYTGSYSSAHLLGLLAAGQETHDWAAGLLAQYELAIQAPKLPVPPFVTAHLETMKNQLTLGTFHLETGVNLLGAVREGKPIADAPAAQGEKLLWEAMEGFFETSQLIAYPGATQPAHPAPPAQASRPRHTPPAAPTQASHPHATPPTAPAQASPLHYTPAAPTPDKRARTAADVANLLGQLEQGQPAGGQAAPASADASSLLDQLQLTRPPPAPPAAPPAAKPKPTPAPEPAQPRPSTEQRVADLLSDLGGEQH
jgi:hypothetical protein